MKQYLSAVIALLVFAGCSPPNSSDAGSASGDDAVASTDAIAAIPADGTMLKADDPPAPVGWTSQPGVIATKYADSTNPLNVLRLFQPAATDSTVLDWFEGRRRTPPDGVENVRTVPEVISESGLLVGYARASQSGTDVAIISYGCSAGGGIRYAELITSQDDGIAAPANKVALGLFTGVCRDALMASAAAKQKVPAPAASAAPVKATPAVAPTDALKSNAIETVLYSWEDGYSGMNYVVNAEAYILLNDRTVRRDIPSAAPADFDLDSDRRTNAANWGTWKKRGGSYVLKFGTGKEFEPPHQTTRLPGKKGERLDRRFQASTGASYGTVYTGSSRSLQFNKDGTFRTSRSSFAGSSAGHGDTSSTVSTSTNDKGSQTALPVPSGGTSSKTGVTDADLTGTYEIDGYTLTLNYNNGQIRRSFFYVTPDREQIWFEGGELAYINLDK